MQELQAQILTPQEQQMQEEQQPSFQQTNNPIIPVQNISDHEYLNSNMIGFNDDNQQNYPYHQQDEQFYENTQQQKIEIEEQNSSEELELENEESKQQLILKQSSKSFDSFDEYSSFNITKKRQPLKVLRKTGMLELNRNINLDLNFMLLGDIFINKDVFIDCRDRKISNICPVSAFRPVIATEKTDKFCLAFVDNTTNGMNDINIPFQLLQSLNFDKAHQVSQQLIQLMHFYQNVQTLQQKVYSFYKNDKIKIEQIIGQNHQKSLQIAQQYIKRITQEKIIMFHYKKIDPATLTHKLHYTGSNMTMSELFTGRSDFSLMEQYMNRIGTPRYIDAEGMVNLTLAKFQGQTLFNLSLITLDDLVIPLNCTIKRIFLNEFEIAPGEKMSEYLDIHVLDTNLNVIQDVLAKRNQVKELSVVNQLEYEMKAEIFIQKFYDGDVENAKKNYEQ